MAERLRKTRRKSYAKLDRTQLRAAYRLYEAGMNVTEIAELIWRRFGYTSVHNCETALRRAWRLEGWPVRPKSEAISMALKKGRRPDMLAHVAAMGAARSRAAASRTHCGKGHELTPENVWLETAKDGYTRRRCRKCMAANSRDARRRVTGSLVAPDTAAMRQSP